MLPTDENNNEVTLNSGVRIQNGDPVVVVNVGPLKAKLKARVDTLQRQEGETNADYRVRQRKLFKVLCAEAAKDWLNVYVRKVNGKLDEEVQVINQKKIKYDSIQDQSEDQNFPAFGKPQEGK